MTKTTTTDDELSDKQIERYARHLVLPEIAEEGQLKLLNAKVLVIGAGGLGSPLLLYLAAAGIGTLGFVDDDSVDLSNLQRQILHDVAAIDQPKVDSALIRLKALNPDITFQPHALRLNSANVDQIVEAYDLVADGCDNFNTRYLVNDACYRQKKPLVSAAIMRFEGQLTSFRAFEKGDKPCYRCLFGNEQIAEKGSCADVGVLGALAGTMGSLQAIEVIKELLGIGESLSNNLLLYDALGTSFHRMRTRRDPACSLCGNKAPAN
ncbi:molybdopterin-synthase adenylyltransferase MoeB [Kiloniella laminariae]|uniref:molybdopterin-synthase adenylyltransferase MoeB n=1 Tax=Kiloniella laminariae TaxID=454162 RepID=UPI00035EF0CD|nr:molybdopterin-synthase adenylyltransferase MoeB [Kiloniella laminariae]